MKTFGMFIIFFNRLIYDFGLVQGVYVKMILILMLKYFKGCILRDID